MESNISKQQSLNATSRKISFEVIKTAYLQAAMIVSIYGDKYLPIFERLEKEFIERKNKRDILQRALKLADKNPI